MSNRKQIFTFTLAPAYADALLRAVAKADSSSYEGVSVSAFVRRVVSEHLEKHGAPVDDKTGDLFDGTQKG